jgi:hypothetical protein
LTVRIGQFAFKDGRCTANADQVTGFDVITKDKERPKMMIRKNSLVLAAAFTGLLGGTMGRLNAAPFNPNPQDAQSDTAKPQEKHACAGKNSCSGKGGCATDGSMKNKANPKKAAEKHACAGKNSCKGKGGCATDGSMKKS